MVALSCRAAAAAATLAALDVAGSMRSWRQEHAALRTQMPSHLWSASVPVHVDAPQLRHELLRLRTEPPGLQQALTADAFADILCSQHKLLLPTASMEIAARRQPPLRHAVL